MPVPPFLTDEAEPHVNSAGAAFAMYWPAARPEALGRIVPVLERTDPAEVRRLAITGFVLFALIGGCSLISNVWGG